MAAPSSWSLGAQTSATDTWLMGAMPFPLLICLVLESRSIQTLPGGIQALEIPTFLLCLLQPMAGARQACTPMSLTESLLGNADNECRAGDFRWGRYLGRFFFSQGLWFLHLPQPSSLLCLRIQPQPQYMSPRMDHPSRISARIIPTPYFHAFSINCEL